MLPLLGYLALAAVFYAPVLLGLRWFPTGDFTDHFLPFSLFQRAEVLAGRLPVWNPYTFSGHPFLADVQAAVFYPVSNLVLALSLPWGGIMQRLYWLQVEVVLQIALAGFFTYLLVRDLVRQAAPAFLAGCVFAFSGYLTGYPPLQTAVLRTAIWLPLILWCLHRAFEDPRGWRWWVAGAFAYVVAFLGGHPQTFLFLSYCVVGWLGLLLALTPGPKAAWLWRIAAFCLLFLGLSTAQLWPSAEFTLLSVRASVDYSFVSGGLPVRDTWQLLAPGVLSQFSPLFVGLVALGLAVLALVWALAVLLRLRAASSERTQAYTTVFFGVVAVLALLASFGSNSFLYPILYRFAPGWSMFRGQERAAYLVVFALSILAGYGLVVFLRLSRRQRLVAAFAWAALAGAGLIAFRLALGLSLDPAAQVALARGAAVGAVALLGAVLAAALRLDARWLSGILTALALVELFAGNAAVNLSDRPVLPPAAAVTVAETTRSPDPALVPTRVQNEGVLPEDYGMWAGVEDVSGSSPLRLARYDALLHDFPQSRLWQLTGVQSLLSSAAALYAPSERVADLSTGSEPAYLYRLAADNPRAWVVNTAYSADDRAALPLLGDERLDLRQTAVLPPAIKGAGRPLGLEDGRLAGAGSSDVRIERRSPTSLRLDVKSETGGYLVVSENWMPGWEAVVVNGGGRRDVPVLRTDLTFLGLPLMAGESTVELNYRPASVRLGLLLSAATLLLLIAVALVPRRQDRARRILADLSSRGLLSRLELPAIVLLGFALRVFRLGNQELRGDESLGRLFSMEPVFGFIRATIALREPHPVFSYVIEGAWLHLAGQTEFALRFVSAWFGALAVAVFYRLTRQLGLPRRTALVAALLLAISPYAVWHSQDARMYSISLALTLGSTLLMLQALGQRRWLPWAGYVAVTWLALHTHYYAAYIIIAQNLFVFIRATLGREERRELPRWILAQAVTLSLYLPWLIVARQTLTAYSGNGDSPAFLALWQRSLSVFVAGETVPAHLQIPLAVLGLILALLGAVRLCSSGPVGRRASLLAGLTSLVPLLATWVGALSRPIFNERYVIAALPGFLLLAAASFAPSGEAQGRPRRAPTRDRWLGWAGAMLAVVLVAATGLSLFLFYNDPAYSKSIGWRQLAAVMKRHTEAWPARVVRAAESYPDPTLWYYYDAAVDKVVIPPAAQDQAGADALVRDLAREGVERIVIAVQGNPAWDSDEIAPRALQGAYKLLLEVPVSNWRVQVYGRSPGALNAVEVGFANGVRLTGASVTPDRAAPGDVLPVHLRWQGDQQALTGNEKITLQLLNADGKLAAQVDQPFGRPDLTGEPVQYALPLPRLLAPGEYRLVLALYDPSREGAPRVLTSRGADHVELKTFTSP
ncbi:MAG: glycosyltransferase family 39 protein [Nitrososphaerales archaeon]